MHFAAAVSFNYLDDFDRFAAVGIILDRCTAFVMVTERSRVCVCVCVCVLRVCDGVPHVPRYGGSYLVLKGCRLRATLTARDSGGLSRAQARQGLATVRGSRHALCVGARVC